MTTATKKMCGACFVPFAANSLKWCPRKVKRVCRKCFGVLAAEAPPPEPKSAQEAEMKWYVVIVGIECDESVVRDMRRNVLIDGYGDRIGKIVAPTHLVTEYKLGKVVKKKVLSFPGYVVVQCHWSEDTHHFIKGTRNVWGVLPLAPELFGKRYARKEPPTTRKPKEWEKEKVLDWKPTALETEEAALILLREQTKPDRKAPAKLTCAKGDKVTVLAGSFAEMEGVVKSIDGDPANPTLTVTVKMWGRDLDVQVAFFEVEKL